ncbi:MAG: UDP-N-acetylmuramoyl-tripeptide--D-alanyl-D-alanine ligase [Pseudomonadota bacterium]
MKSTLQQLHPYIAGAVMAADVSFDGISTDSRNVKPGNLFLALRGEHYDAHDFLPQVAALGVAAVVAEYLPAGLDVPALVVPDTRIALGQIATYWRRQFTLPVIGVTGSNGKTTVKEMIASILAAAYGAGHSLATRGNLNNDIGVPLTLFRLEQTHRAAVIELGMNHPGEIALLSSIAQPSIGLVNNAQREHQEFMQSIEAVAEENGAVLRSLGPDSVAVFPADDPFSALWRTYAGQRRIVSFGLCSDADVSCTYQATTFGSALQVKIGTASFGLQLAAAGSHNVRNALAAIACTHAIGIEVDAIVQGLEAFAPVNGRLQCKPARNGVTLIDDTYNANPDSVLAAIDVLKQAAAPRILVLGDMGEVGNDGRRFHQEIGSYAHACGIDVIFTLGDLASDSSLAFGTGATHFDDIQALFKALDVRLAAGTTVLVKGSRFMKMERVVQYLALDNLTQKSQEVH